MSDEQVFEFAANSLARFRVYLFPGSLMVETMPRKGGAIARTWKASYAEVQDARLSDRVGRRSHTSSVKLKTRAGEYIFLGWQAGVMGTTKEDGQAYYAAMGALLRRLAAHHPGLVVKLGPGPRIPFFVGMAISTAAALYLAGFFDGPWTTGSWIVTGIVAIAVAYSVWRSGILRKSHELSLEVAAADFDAKAAAL